MLSLLDFSFSIWLLPLDVTVVLELLSLSFMST